MTTFMLAPLVVPFFASIKTSDLASVVAQTAEAIGLHGASWRYPRRRRESRAVASR
ncbi:hypothetical protein [Nitratireductor sp. GCM10026969]|uniref:hypothetical protein n=1 Tax=Nitratireductor sp. GCM10026969 TaxID=3252645 RepID=UPI0036114251